MIAPDLERTLAKESAAARLERFARTGIGCSARVPAGLKHEATKPRSAEETDKRSIVVVRVLVDVLVVVVVLVLVLVVVVVVVLVVVRALVLVCS